MKAWDLRDALGKGVREVEGEMAAPHLGEESVFVVMPPGKARGYLLKPEEWAIDGRARRRKVAEIAARMTSHGA